jgi:hypothetical protein
VKSIFISIVGLLALLVVTTTGAIMHITNPDTTIVVSHDYQGGTTNFGDGFTSYAGEFGSGDTDSGAFRNVDTQTKRIACSTNFCMEKVTVTGNRWPGEVQYATDIVWGYENGSFSQLSRSSDQGIWAPEVPSTPSIDPQKCVAEICDTQRKAQEDTNALALAKAKGAVTVGKWVAGVAAGLAGAALSPIAGAIYAGSAYQLVKEAGSDIIDGLDQGMKTQIVINYKKCKTKCGA